jgi:hypothetical protein
MAFIIVAQWLTEEPSLKCIFPKKGELERHRPPESNENLVDGEADKNEETHG